MRLQHALIAIIVGIAVGASDIAAETARTLIISGPQTGVKPFRAEIDVKNQRRRLRSYKADGGEKEDSNDTHEETRNILYKQLFPAWYASGKTPETIFVELQSPTLDHKNWPIYKSYKAYYDTYHVVYP
ncbi:hypothetical protein PPTG_21519 [Phytophthora nicotianae INRA-310]|uniref:RxLR effector protein n=1 Tax=Phytophthora nicotianae (strain INRA-310) TaxID=761204 RepID=W2QYR6_PHYN3|nr:hypothetical protein PPTG_21519 [Phytophthora nicotianae INRA-310]ETN18121.1 hypothetical protein PPTG_21519 [Phytophthora nicotianae INRA-310]